MSGPFIAMRIVMGQSGPKSYCELADWIYRQPDGQEMNLWVGRPLNQRSVDEFKSEFAKLVSDLGGRGEIPSGLSLDETKLFAWRLIRQLIFDEGEVPTGWQQAFEVPQSPLDGCVFIPPHPVRTVSEVLRFMDHQRQQSRISVLSPFGPAGLGAERLKIGIKAAWLWLVQQGYESGPIPAFPDEVWKVSDLFDDIYFKVKSADTGTRKPRSDEPTEGDVILGRRLLNEMKAQNPSVEAFRKHARANGLPGSNAKLGKVYTRCIAEKKNPG